MHFGSPFSDHLVICASAGVPAAWVSLRSEPPTSIGEGARNAGFSRLQLRLLSEPPASLGEGDSDWLKSWALFEVRLRMTQPRYAPTAATSSRRAITPS